MSHLDFLSQRRRRSPLAGAFFAPGNLSGIALIQTLAELAGDLVRTHPAPSHFQKRNARSLLWKIKILLSLFQYLIESSSSSLFCWFPDSATLCFRELYILIYRSKILLDYCAQSGRLWLVLRGTQISGNFRDLDQELWTLLDVLPIEGLRLSPDVREQLQLLRRHCAKSNLNYESDQDEQEQQQEELRAKMFEFLDEFSHGEAPDPKELQSFYVDHLGIRDGPTCHSEIEFLEEQIFNHEEYTDLPLLGGTVALTRYCRFLLFNFEESEAEMTNLPFSNDQLMKLNRRIVSWGGNDSSSFGVPKDFCCPISLDLMRDPVVVSTGQTYDRSSIIQWIEEGHATCPNSGQLLVDNRLIPNRALHSLISQWCATYGMPYESVDTPDGSIENIAVACASKAAVAANQATVRILVHQLEDPDGSDSAKTIAAHELRLLAKTGKQNRAFIAELGAIPLLSELLRSPNPDTQENAVTALLNLSIFDVNKRRIMEQEGCLSLINEVLINGRTTEARENAAATLFSLSVVHEYKKRIISEPGAVETLAGMLKKGTPRGRKDAVMALYNLSTHPESWAGMLDSGAVSALATSLVSEPVAEEAAGALALLMKQPGVAHAVAGLESTMPNLVSLMRRGSPKGKENAVAALQEMCRRGGPVLTQHVSRTAGLEGLVQVIILTGTKRARRKAAQLAKLLRRVDSTSFFVSVGPSVGSVDQSVVGQSVVGPAPGGAGLRRVPSFGNGDLSMTTPMAISVPVP